jgi:hypothetical protein
MRVKIGAGASQARLEDAQVLRKARQKFISMVSTIPIDPPLDERLKKSNMGFNHKAITRMLMPAKHLARFDADMDT